MKKLSVRVAIALVMGMVLDDSSAATTAGKKVLVANAEALFKNFVELEHAYDPAVADLYSDSALITNKRTYPTGQVREMSMPATQYKAIIRKWMPLAKSRGDRSTYSECMYTALEKRVRIQCTRFSELKKYSSLYILVVGPDSAGKWLILEEFSESRPF
ncbi:MAG: hypothetical protein K0Q91_1169 [Fibrobacteria bacterium]|jgi:hypothetical protein|nr:hypothetical protein [Fibrobacteria bacterium]